MSMGDYYLKNEKEKGHRHPLELDESCLNFDKSQVQVEGGDLRLAKAKDVSCFDLEVIEVHNANDVNFAETHATSVLVDVELLDACYGKRFIIVPSSEHGYNLRNDHKDEDLTLIKKRRAYKKIWQ